jgi:pimeloyl-ACP methyl ester carboxylesterase
VAKKQRRTASRRRQRRPAAAAIAPALRSAQQLRDEDVERMLATGERRGLLEDYFGPELERELAELASEALRQPLRGGPRVWILPGTMGSELGRRRNGSTDLLWIDPVDIVRGRLLSLALPDAGAIVACGTILFAYLKLKLRLRLAGFAADFVPFDWRRSVRELGAELADRLESAPGKVHLVAHSLGGLVARAALARARASRRIASVVMLGTPNHGSFAALQALRGSYPVVRKIAALGGHAPEDLARRVFTTFPSLHEMLPTPERWSGEDLYDAGRWPSDAPAPHQAMLDAARATQRTLPEPVDDERFALIAGVDQQTTVGVRFESGEVCYERSQDGDGTVPLALALLPSVRTWYVQEAHGSLPNNGSVIDAVIDLLRSGQTSRLPTTRAPGVRPLVCVPESELRRDPLLQREPATWSTRDVRQLADELVSARAREAGPPLAAGALPLEAPAPGLRHSLRDVEVTRRRAHSIEICLARGSITEAPAHALTLGIFQGVDPAGAARAVDERMRGVIREFITRRMLSAEVGAVSVLPTGRHLLHADSVLFVGLGSFDGFRDDVQQFVAENIVRTFVRTHVEDFATVLFGAGSGWSVQSLLYNQLRGFVRGLVDADRDHRMRRITICETNPERFQELKEELYRLASTELFGELVVTFDEARLPEPLETPGAARRAPPLRDHAYLVVSREERTDTRQVFRAAVLTAGGRAAVVAGVREVEDAALDRLLARIESRAFTAAKLPPFGNELAELVLDPTVAEVLLQQRSCHLVVVHDAVSSRIPWETLCIADWFPAAEQGLSRRYAAQNLSVAKWLEERRLGETLELLLVTNPTADLDGAEREARRLKALFPSGSTVRIDEVAREKATRSELLARLRSGRYDVVHYAGHAFFDPEAPARSGILCHGDEVLSGAHLAELANLPSLVFFNACEAGRIRSPQLRRRRELDVARRVDRTVGLAEAFLRGGVANYVGTYWPVGDASAETFATTFYGGLVEGLPLGAALQAGRQAVRALASVDWADYIHYGTYDFALKREE